MAPTFAEFDDRYLFNNEDATWTIWKKTSYDTNGYVVGPGYVGKGVFRGTGKIINDPFMKPGTVINDPNIQGIGLVGWHHYRAIPGETEIWNKGWDMGSNRPVGTDPFGVKNCDVIVKPFLDQNGALRASFGVNFVDRYSAAENKRIALIRYDYVIESSNIKMWTSFTEFPDGFDSGPTPYLKEPKYTVSLGGSTYQPNKLDIFNKDAMIQSYDLINDPKLQNPTRGTRQMARPTRTRVRFSDGKILFNVVAEGNSAMRYGLADKVLDYGIRKPWYNSGYGLDQFAADADTRESFDSTVCPRYCLTNGKLSRKWEIAKSGKSPKVQIMFHGWEGGYGLPDCLCAAKKFKEKKTWVNYFSISRDSGWTL